MRQQDTGALGGGPRLRRASGGTRAGSRRPAVLLASVSPYEGLQLERALARTGWDLRRVDDAAQTARYLDGGGRPTVLVIDAGLLEMTHDPQWRLLRTQHPRLAMVVRCLIPQDRGFREQGESTFLVHPDDDQGMCRAIRAAVVRRRPISP